MRALETWAEGVFKPLAMLAHVAASAAEDCEELLQRLDEKPSLAWAFAKDIQPEAWLRCYECPALVGKAFLEMAKLIGGFDEGALPTESRALERWLRRLARWQRKIWQGRGYMVEAVIDRHWESHYRNEHLPRLRLVESGVNPMMEAAKPLFYSAEFVFFLTVVAPCWLRYQTLPWLLYEQAVEGDFESLKRLLKLDPMADQSSRLSAVLFRIQQENPNQFKKLQRTKGGRRTRRKEELKALIGGWLMTMAGGLRNIFNAEILIEIRRRCTPAEQLPALEIEIKEVRAAAARHALKSRLSAAKIVELYHALAEVRGRGKVDAELVCAPDAAERQLRRKAKLWPPLWESDKTSAA